MPSKLLLKNSAKVWSPFELSPNMGHRTNVLWNAFEPSQTSVNELASYSFQTPAREIQDHISNTSAITSSGKEEVTQYCRWILYKSIRLGCQTPRISPFSNKWQTWAMACTYLARLALRRCVPRSRQFLKLSRNDGSWRWTPVHMRSASPGIAETNAVPCMSSPGWDCSVAKIPFP